MMKITIILLIFLFTFSHLVSGSLRKLWFDNGKTISSGFCGHVLAPNNQQKFKLKDMRPSKGCNRLNNPVGNDTLYVVERYNCSFDQKLSVALMEGAGGVVVTTTSKLLKTFSSPRLNQSILAQNSFIFTSGEDLDRDKASISGPSVLVIPGDEVTVRRFDASTVILMSMAVVSVLLGATWSSYTRHQLFMEALRREMKKRRESPSIEGSEEVREGAEAAPEPATLPVQWVAVCVLVVFMVLFIVLLYFFYKYLVYVIMILYVVGGAQAICGCLSFIINRVDSLRITIDTSTKCCIRHLFTSVTVAELATFPVGLAFTLWWFIERKASYSWILQDIIGCLFVLHLLNNLRLPSAKVASMLLLGLFVYDVFFVYITPYFTKDGRSIMESVAVPSKGDGEPAEQLPIMLIMPKLSVEPWLSSCISYEYSLLGLGDLAIPGLLVSYLAGFDLILMTRCRVYLLTATLAYTVGLLLALLGLYLMSSAQPALFFIVPTQFIGAGLVCGLRKEFKIIWSGDVPSSCVRRLIPDEYIAADEDIETPRDLDKTGSQKQ